MHRFGSKHFYSSISRLQKATQHHKIYQNNNRNYNDYRYSKGNKEIPHFQEASFGKFILFFSPLAVAGATITYAKYNEDFRKLVERNVPGSDRIFRITLEDEPAFPSVTKRVEDIKSQFGKITDSVGNATSSVTSLFGSSSSKKEIKDKPDELPFMSPKTTPPPAEVNNKTLQEPKFTVQKPDKPKVTPTTTAPIQAPNPIIADTSLPKDILELEKEIEISAALAVKEYNKAIDVLKAFNEDVRQVVDRAVENFEVFSWNSLKNRTNARDTAVSTAESLALEAIHKMERCEIALSNVVNASNQEKVLAIRNKIKNFEDHITKSKDELYKNKDLASISEKYWRNVEKARNYFVEEIEGLFPGLNLSEKKFDLTKDDIDLFILHAYSHVLALQKELQRLQTDGELRLRRAIEISKTDNNEAATQAQLEYLLEAEKRRLALENQKKIFQIRAESSKELRNSLKKQSEAHMDHLQDALAMKEVELKRSYNKEMEEKLATERSNYKLQLAAMLGKLRGMDAALQARAESERSAHQAQALWAACQSLWSVVRTGEPGVNWSKKLRPLQNEIQAISTVAEGDELVSIVLNSMPEEALQRGVYPEDALKERFFNVERIARKLALVPEEGASLPMFALSYLQSLFIMRPNEPISKEELEDKPFDFSKLDTYDILNRARYFIDHGDLMQALKYMNLLQGAPRKVASDWLKETRLLLETQQAANTLMAHAAASGLLYL